MDSASGLLTVCTWLKRGCERVHAGWGEGGCHSWKGFKDLFEGNSEEGDIQQVGGQFWVKWYLNLDGSETDCMWGKMLERLKSRKIRGLID